MSAPAAERRLAAIQAVSDQFITREGVQLMSDREAIAALIDALAPLGRTARWQAAVAVWAERVRDLELPLIWAYQQYAIYACHAAE